MIRLLFSTLFLLTVSTLSFAQDKVFNAEFFDLDNGMQIVVIPNHRAPVVTHMVWYKAGAADEPAGKSGIAHFLEHLLFKGSTYIDKNGETQTLPPGEFSKIVKALGGRDNAFTGQDYTAYFQSIATEHLETLMRMEAGRIRGAQFPEDQVNAERRVILEERRQRIDNNPQAQFGENLDTALYVNHPYSKPIIGWMHEMESLSRADALAYYNHYYQPNNAILIVAGDVSGQEVFALAKKIYGPLPRGADIQRVRPVSPELPGNILLEKTLETVREPVVQIMMKAPSYAENAKDSYALQVLENILSGGSSSRLYRSLVSEKKIASSVGFSYRPTALNQSQIWLHGVPAQGVEPDVVKDALREEIRNIIEHGVGEEELHSAVTRLQNQAVFALDSLSGPAMIFGQALTTQTDINDIEYWPHRLGKVSGADVQRVAKSYLDPDAGDRLRIVTGYLLPRPKVEDIAETPEDKP